MTNSNSDSETKSNRNYNYLGKCSPTNYGKIFQLKKYNEIYEIYNKNTKELTEKDYLIFNTNFPKLDALFRQPEVLIKLLKNTDFYIRFDMAERNSFFRKIKEYHGENLKYMPHDTQISFFIDFKSDVNHCENCDRFNMGINRLYAVYNKNIFKCNCQIKQNFKSILNYYEHTYRNEKLKKIKINKHMKF